MKGFVCHMQAAGLPPAEGAAPWQKHILQELALLGPGANAEVIVGRQPIAEPRLLAALRVLTAAAASDVPRTQLRAAGRLDCATCSKARGMRLSHSTSHASWRQSPGSC